MMLPVQSRRFSSIKGLGSVVSKRLLIVEDDPGLQSQMRWCFSDDIEVVMASDRDSAITSLRRFEPEVVTLDLGLPPDPGGATEGFALLEDILRLAPNTKVVVVTGREDKENAVRAIGMGASDFYQKPLDADILTFVVNRAFRLSELERENRELAQSRNGTNIKGIVAASPQMLALCRMVEKVAPPFPRICLKASCSALRKAHLPAPPKAKRARSRWPTAARCFWMKSGICRWPFKPSCYDFSRSA